MRKILLSLICILGIGVVPLVAQDDTVTEAIPLEVNYDCTTTGINRQADMWYNDYVVARGELEPEQAMLATQELADNLAELTAACTAEAEAEPEEVMPQTGLGTIDVPYIIQAPGVVGDTTIDITRSILPANDVLAETGVPGADVIPEGQEYFLLNLTAICREGSTNGCRIGDNAFRVIGDLGTLYAPTLSQIDHYFPGHVPMLAGSERSGVIPFLVNEDDTSLRLAYFPNGDGHENNALAYYFDAQGSPNSFEVRATTSELIIRNRPVNGAPISVLRGGQIAQASGRNVDGTWIYIEAPEGTGWVSADFLTSDSSLETLSVLDEE